MAESVANMCTFLLVLASFTVGLFFGVRYSKDLKVQEAAARIIEKAKALFRRNG